MIMFGECTGQLIFQIFLRVSHGSISGPHLFLLHANDPSGGFSKVQVCQVANYISLLFVDCSLIELSKECTRVSKNYRLV